MRNGTVILSRGSKVSAVPQPFLWERLLPPLLTLNREEIVERLRSEPPSCVGPRGVASSLFVCPVTATAPGSFIPEEQAIRLTVQDVDSNPISLVHRYQSEGHEGCEELLELVSSKYPSLRYILGHFHLGGEYGLEVQPLGMVYEESGLRRLCQPFLGSSERPELRLEGVSKVRDEGFTSPIKRYLSELSTSLGNVIELGVGGVDRELEGRMVRLKEWGDSLGLERISGILSSFLTLVGARHEELSWEPAAAVEVALELLCILRVARDAS